MDTLEKISTAIEQANIHSKYDGYTGNCANIAVAVYEVAIEELRDDLFRFAVIDRPSHFGSGPDHIALEYDGKYLDSKGVHSRKDLKDSISSDNNEAALQIESKQYVMNYVSYYDESVKDEIKQDLQEYLWGI